MSHPQGWHSPEGNFMHYSDVIMSMMAFQITGVPIVCSTVCPGADQRKHESSASLAFVRGSHRWLVNSPHKGPVTWKMFPYDDVIMGRRARHEPLMCVWKLHFQNVIHFSQGPISKLQILMLLQSIISIIIWFLSTIIDFCWMTQILIIIT